MALTIERLRYYDGEFLRAFDWTAEQTYQIEMRRRLHLALGHWGIVEGLDIATDAEGSTKTFSINPGVAIDPAGREIFVFNSYQLDDTLLNANLIVAANTYQLLLQYQLTPNTPPSAGYGQCNGGNQYTRWQESFVVLIRPNNWTQPTPLPKATDALSENAAHDGFAVPLARITIKNDPSGSLVVQGSIGDNRRYYGTRTQLITVPVKPASTDLTAAQTPTDPATSLELLSTVYVHDDLIVGPNFSLGSSPPSPTSPGTVKVAGDIVLQGKIYTLDNAGNWTDLASAIQAQVVPQVTAPATVTVDITPNATGTGSYSPAGPIYPANPLPAGFTVAVNAWLAGVIWADKTTVDNVFTAAAGAGLSTQVQYQVTASATATTTGGALLTFNYTVGPVAQIPPVSASTPWECAIDSLVIGYSVIFTP
jgi:hypothetical protein